MKNQEIINRLRSEVQKRYGVPGSPNSVKALILAAGYATRLYPLTKNFPKPLLEVGPKTILDYLVDQLREIPEIEECYLVTNHRFTGHFEDWARKRMEEARREVKAHKGIRLDILDDGTSSNEDRLGAVGDIRFVIQERGISEDLLVCAADNIFQFSVAGFVSAFKKRQAAHICVRKIEDLADRRRRGIAVLGEEDRVVEFKEKPENPKSHWAAPPLYMYPAATLARIEQYLEEGGTSDAPGHLIEWLCTVEPVYAYRVDGEVLDIGNPESLAEARAAMGS